MSLWQNLKMKKNYTHIKFPKIFLNPEDFGVFEKEIGLKGLYVFLSPDLLSV